MNSYLNAFIGEINAEFSKKHNQALTKREMPQTTPAIAEAVDYICELLQSVGFKPERIDFPSDGKTSYQDKIMPICWDVKRAKLTVMSEWEGERVIADYEKEPFSIIRYSTETPKEGLTAPLVTWDDMIAGKSVKDAFVLLPQGMFPTDKALVPILNNGGIGIVSGTISSSVERPDSLHWGNNCTETNSWHVNADERPFLAYSITPRTLEKLENAYKKGEIILKAESDGHRFEGTMPAVTTLLKGESEKEFWVLAHTAEPLEDDNSAGVICCIQSLMAIKKALAEGKIPSLKYSIRLLFAPEMYGFAAFAEHFGGQLHNRCIGALNVDGIPVNEETDTMKIMFAPAAVPFYGNILFEGMWDEYRRTVKKTPFFTSWSDHWGDDCILSDSSVGLPTLMPEYDNKYSWHNSEQCVDGCIDYDKFARVCAVYTAYIASVAAYDGKILEKFLPMAVSYASARIAELAQKAPERKGIDAKARINHRKILEQNNIKSFKDAGVSEEAINKACSMLDAFVNGITPVPTEEKTEPTPVFDSMENIIPKRTSIGVPHDFARVPLERRWHPINENILNRVFSSMDGKRNLKDLIIEAEWEARTAFSEAQLTDLIETLKFMDEFKYIKLN